MIILLFFYKLFSQITKYLWYQHYKTIELNYKSFNPSQKILMYVLGNVQDHNLDFSFSFWIT